MATTKADVVLISIMPYDYSFRAKKAAKEYSSLGKARFLGLRRAGRSGSVARVRAGQLDGVDVQHVNNMPINQRRLGGPFNALFSYLPGLLVVALRALRIQAPFIHVAAVHLLPVAVLHKAIHNSRIILDVEERPASVGTPGSLYSRLTAVEALLLRRCARWVWLSLCVAPGHGDLLREVYGHERVVLVRNVPERDWISQRVQEPTPYRVVTVGSIFEGRAFELMIDAMHLIKNPKVHIEVYGSGRLEYTRMLNKRIHELGVGSRISINPPVPGRQVCGIYQTAALGLALYDASHAGNDSLSNKILETVASGTTVLAGALDENARFVSTHGVGWTTEVSAEAIAASLDHIFADNSGLSGARARCEAIGQDFHWSAEFAQVLDKCRQLKANG